MKILGKFAKVRQLLEVVVKFRSTTKWAILLSQFSSSAFFIFNDFCKIHFFKDANDDDENGLNLLFVEHCCPGRSCGLLKNISQILHSLKWVKFSIFYVSIIILGMMLYL